MKLKYLVIYFILGTVREGYMCVDFLQNITPVWGYVMILADRPYVALFFIVSMLLCSGIFIHNPILLLDSN